MELLKITVFFDNTKTITVEDPIIQKITVLYPLTDKITVKVNIS